MQKTWDMSLIPGLGRSPGEGNSNPLQYSCLESSTGRGTWWATVCGVSKSGTRLGLHSSGSHVPGMCYGFVNACFHWISPWCYAFCLHWENDIEATVWNILCLLSGSFGKHESVSRGVCWSGEQQQKSITRISHVSASGKMCFSQTVVSWKNQFHSRYK